MSEMLSHTATLKYSDIQAKRAHPLEKVKRADFPSEG
jgi:hypothetical protein